MVTDASQKGFECASTLSLAHSGQVAVVQKNNPAGLERGCDFSNNAGGIVWHAVVAGGRPTGEFQPKFSRGEVDERVRHSDGSAKPRRLASRRFTDRSGATSDLTAGAARAGGPKAGGGVRKCVVLHQMTLVPHPAAQLGVGGGFFPDHKKLRPHFLAGEEIENLRSLAGIGAVIDRQAQLRTSRGKAVFNGAEPRGIPNNAGENQQPPEEGTRKAVAAHGCEVLGNRKILSPSRPRFWR